ncbi:cobalamin-dependent protein [Conexibacter sp. JD483]|uniref:cobalamin B12-binding domain-containing protein n=1 Tax=unclassified Conexibacter TaxID=2627773 RepID=UPI00271CC772|nr:MULTISPECIES: cobalamin-dependent protein [unclassified Conexibacter]MDO8187966.1 cobalamin-dependent protein [Conexibacter sp. CPCC 205706]MDO8200165.1 cobalamin-dependent protein [Conexibacter sp. CPCC 205762]MDR9369711.1 cobalamin-dependent protein [Conexibacter sp. JD483]
MTVDPSHTQLSSLLDRYLRALLDGDVVAARACIGDALELLAPEAVYTQVVAAALSAIGDGWERSTVTIAEEHLATSLSEVIVADLASRLARSRRRHRTVIVACGPNELHAVGSRIVADFLDADGWDVLHLGAMTPGPALAELAVARNASVVAISVALSSHLPEVGKACARLRALPFAPLVVLGGQAVSDEQIARAAGADFTAGSLPELLRRLDERLPRHEPPAR